MGIEKIDFLSDSPKNSIFNNKVNKTKFGGFLTLLFIIITLIILAYYLIYYFTEQTFSIEYTFNEKIISENERLERLESETYNPYLNFAFNLILDNGANMTDDFIIVNKKKKLIPRYTLLEKRISDIDLYILYKCGKFDINCTIPKIGRYFTFETIIQRFILDHQNEDLPLHKAEEDNWLCYQHNIIFMNPLIIQYHWRTIKYKKDPGILKFLDKLRGIDEEKQQYIGIKEYGDSSSQQMKTMVENENEFIEEINGTNYKVLGSIIFPIDFNQYEEYSRVKKDIFDYLSNVCSLSIVVFKILSLFLTKIYSYNFNNYKIVEKILFDIKFDKKGGKKIEEINNLNKKELLLLENENENSYEDNPEYSINELEDNNIRDKKNKKRILPKFNLFDFILNNIYCKCCKIRKHELISRCNEFIAKYYSIENIIYNQIKFDNIFKDYKWNNPELNNFDKNELIIQLKNLINDGS